MAFDLPFNYHQNTHMNITILVVDDDPLFLAVIPNMLKNPSYRDKSFGEITVMTANGSSEAISTLRGQCNNIDVVITDYHMPGLNGVQLKKKIDEEFGNLPVIVISADMNNEIEQETLSSGAMCFLRKPIQPNDLNIIWKHALNYKMNENSKKIQKTNSTSNPYDGDSRPHAKSKVKWTSSLEDLFYKAIHHIGLHKATPKRILEFMNVQYLTRAHIASKLQKYRNFLKKVKEEAIEEARKAMNPSYIINPQHPYNYNTSLTNNSLFNSQPGYGLGQFSPIMNNNAGLHDSVNYTNRRPTYDLSQTGSNLLPMRGNLGFSNGMLPLKEERRSISGASQESQASRFGKYGTTSDVLAMDSNLSTGIMGSNYGGIRINENGDLVGLGRIRDNGNGNGNGVHGTGNGNGSLDEILVHGTSHGNGNGDDSFGGVRVHDNGNGYGSLSGIRVHGTGNDNGSLDGIRVHGTSNGNDDGYGSLGGIRVDGTSNGNGSLDGIRVSGNGNRSGDGYGSLGGIRVYGIGNNNGSLDGIRVHGTGPTGNGIGDGYDSLGGIRVHSIGNNNGSLDGIRVHGTGPTGNGNGDGYGSLGGIRVHGTVNGNGSFDGIRVHGTGPTSNGSGDGYGSLGGIKVHGTGNGNGSLDGIRVHGIGSIGNGNGDGYDSLGGIRVHGTGNGNGSGSLGDENLGGLNWNFNNNSMSNHGSSTSRFPSALSSFSDNDDTSQNNLIGQTDGMTSQNNLIGQTDGMVPVLENPSKFTDHHGINEVFCNTVNSQFDKNQHQDKVAGENLGVSTACPLEDISNWSFNNGNNNEETLNPVTANSEMCSPTGDMNITNQEHGVGDLTDLLFSFNQDSDDEEFMKYLLDPDMN